MSRVRSLLSQGNGKLGSAIHVFSLPAITTCPGRSSICASVCYATKSRFAFPRVKAALRYNHRQIKRADFVSRMSDEISSQGVLVLRVHASGDFVSAKYGQKWLAIFKRFPKVRFYAYTRSYRIPEIAVVLEQMAALKNVRLWFSVDAETGTPENVPQGVKLAYLQVTEDDLPEQADLVFRPRRMRRLKPLPMTCPSETQAGKGTVCGSCQRCWQD